MYIAFYIIYTLWCRGCRWSRRPLQPLEKEGEEKKTIKGKQTMIVLHGRASNANIIGRDFEFI